MGHLPPPPATGRLHHGVDRQDALRVMADDGRAGNASADRRVDRQLRVRPRRRGVRPIRPRRRLGDALHAVPARTRRPRRVPGGDRRQLPGRGRPLERRHLSPAAGTRSHVFPGRRSATVDGPPVERPTVVPTAVVRAAPCAAYGRPDLGRPLRRRRHRAHRSVRADTDDRRMGHPSELAPQTLTQRAADRRLRAGRCPPVLRDGVPDRSAHR